MYLVAGYPDEDEASPFGHRNTPNAPGHPDVQLPERRRTFGGSGVDTAEQVKRYRGRRFLDLAEAAQAFHSSG
jgi:hypothetical protein